MDGELRRLREEQKKQVLPKPKINSNADEVNDNIDSKKLSSSEVVPAQPNIKVDNDNPSPKIQGGQDKSSQAQKRRDTVKAVRYFFFNFASILIQVLALIKDCVVLTQQFPTSKFPRQFCTKIVHV